MQYSQFQEPIGVQQNQGSSCFKPIFACLLAPVLLFLCIAACGVACVAAVAMGSPKPLDKDFKPSQAQAQAYENSISTALSSVTPGNGQFTIRMQEDEFASWLNYQYKDLMEKYFEGDNESIQNLDLVFQAEFDNQQIAFYAETKVALFKVAALIRAEVSPPQGNLSATLLDVNIVSFKLAALDVTDGQSGFEDDLAKVLTDRLQEFADAAGGDRITITQVDSQNGVLTLTGQLSPETSN